LILPEIGKFLVGLTVFSREWEEGRIFFEDWIAS
jgi:hypothetical protein